MREFSAEIIETLQRTVKIDALSEQDALKGVKEQYSNEDIVLGARDFVQVELSLFGSSKKILDYYFLMRILFQWGTTLGYKANNRLLNSPIPLDSPRGKQLDKEFK